MFLASHLWLPSKCGRWGGGIVCNIVICSPGCILCVVRGKTPIVVGGTGFYLRWYIHGKAKTPVSCPGAAAQVEALLEDVWSAAQAEGDPLSEDQKWQIGVDLVARLGDPEAAERIR